MEKYIAGLGNYAKNDDGIGLRITEYIVDNQLEKGFKAVEIGNDGMRLLTYFSENTEKIVVVDCALMDLQPGEYRIFSPEDVINKKVNDTISTHEGDILKLIDLGKQLGYVIPKITIMAIQPESLEMDMTLSPTISGRLQEYVETAIKTINAE